MKRKSLAVLRLAERVARVREIQAQQALSGAINQESAQRERVEATSARLCDADAALRTLQLQRRLDLARLGLYRDLATSIDETLVHEEDVLLGKCKERSARSSELMRVTHYRKQVSERATKTGQAMRQEAERRASEVRLEAWLLRDMAGDGQ
ncbi:MAG: hypothetical protein ACTHMO_09035 [Rhodanobacteraceae bacterium]